MCVLLVFVLCLCVSVGECIKCVCVWTRGSRFVSVRWGDIGSVRPALRQVLFCVVYIYLYVIRWMWATRWCSRQCVCVDFRVTTMRIAGLCVVFGALPLMDSPCFRFCRWGWLYSESAYYEVDWKMCFICIYFIRVQLPVHKWFHSRVLPVLYRFT